jgi:hypothetical protein
MSGGKNVDFYGAKSVDEPKLVYRRLAMVLRDNPDRRAPTIAGILQELTGSHDEFRRFKFALPEFLRRVLTPEEAQQFQAATAARRAHATRLKMVFPSSSDEFNLDPEFLASVFDLSDGPEVASSKRFFTIGSCFARNIAMYLRANGCDAETFSLAEDLNSPISNAFLFHILQRPQPLRLEAVALWLRKIYPEMVEDAVQQVAALKLRDLESLVEKFVQADCVVMTLGNVVDFFRGDAELSQPLMDKVFPKFIALPVAEDIASVTDAAARLKKQGAILRMATYAETCEAIVACVEGIRSITAAPIVITLSPVPVDSVIGIAGSVKSAVEADCISKSRLRSALDEVLPGLQSAQAPIHYYPSFEIVRWIAPLLSMPAFGLEDAAARHVSGPILNAVCDLFFNRFVRWDVGAEAAPQPAALADR